MGVSDELTEQLSEVYKHAVRTPTYVRPGSFIIAVTKVVKKGTGCVGS